MGHSESRDHVGSASIVIGVLVVLLLLTLFTLAFYAVPKYWREHYRRSDVPAVSASSRQHQRALTDSASLSSSANLYDFYTELKKPHGSSPSLKTLATSTTGQFALQLAVFSDKKSAHRLVDRLAIQGYQASVSNYKQGLRSLYRVFLGPYVSIEASRRDQQHLSKLQVDYIVVPYQSTEHSTT